MKKQRVKYVSVKLPACDTAYPLDKHGCRKLPSYTPKYLKQHAKKLFDILMNDVPATLYSELVRIIKQKEKP